MLALRMGSKVVMFVNVRAARYMQPAVRWEVVSVRSACDVVGNKAGGCLGRLRGKHRRGIS